MANPLNSLFQPQSPALSVDFSKFQQAAQMLKSAQNPSAVISQIAQQNPQMRQIVQMCQGRDPRQLFIDECRRRGIDPEQAMRSMGLH